MIACVFGGLLAVGGRDVWKSARVDGVRGSMVDHVTYNPILVCLLTRDLSPNRRGPSSAFISKRTRGNGPSLVVADPDGK